MKTIPIVTPTIFIISCNNIEIYKMIALKGDLKEGIEQSLESEEIKRNFFEIMVSVSM